MRKWAVAWGCVLSCLAASGCSDSGDGNTEPGTGATRNGFGDDGAGGMNTGSDGQSQNVAEVPGSTTGASGDGEDGAAGGSAGRGGDAATPNDDGAGDTTPSGTGNDSGGDGDDMTTPPIDEPPTTGPFPPVDDFTRAGPYTSTTLPNVGPNGNHYVYMPSGAPPEGAGFPLVAWTSGGGTTHALYTLLPHLASHGFVVVTSNTIPGIGAEASLGQEILAGLDWVIAENGREGSMLFGRVDTMMLASAGYSMGSLATFEIADDPRLVTTVHISGGSMAAGVVSNLHAPAAFICGIPNPSCTNLLDSTCDIAGANCQMDFEAATTPVFYATFEAGHLGILTPPFTERINAMTTAWLRNRLMGDTTLDSMFLGADCEYCSDANWTIAHKNL